MSQTANRTPAFRITAADIPLFLLWLAVFYFTWLFMHGADHFLEMTPAALHKYFKFRYALIAHITAGGGSLVLGLVQFWPKLRRYSVRAHRIIGLLYLLAVLVSSLTAVILAFTTAYAVNWAYAFSLQVWVTVWISSTLIGYTAAVKKRFKSHREWMVRSYLVTLAFIFSGLAVKTETVQQLGSFADISPSFFWMGWAAPLYIYQVVLAWKEKK